MKTQETRPRLVVMSEHTLGMIRPNSRYIEIFRESMLRGARHTTNAFPDSKLFNEDEVRLATEKDFEDFRVVFKSEKHLGFSNRNEYIYQ